MTQQPSTRERLLAAAERVLLSEGVDGLSLRSVTAAAGVNVASVNYTFGGKDALLEALSERLLEPLTAERIRRIDEVTQAQNCTVEDLLTAYTMPLLGMDLRVAPLYIELLVKPRVEDNARLRQVGVGVIRPGLDRLLDALQVALPEHPREILEVRIQLLFGGATLCLRDWITTGADRAPLVRELVAVGTAGLSAPTPSQGKWPQG
ncbi:TetR/AcrR family transcriptional regulator [Mycobacteroides immunogenum]|uniref:TetR/AcrR family transcriptional regulator n=1 Tax=Mycobacteroides immunogenum TaxID=83262 RepID=UPI0025B75817|nr:TetR/AcrR family transcriptional regulator [Mycobacteroides immunogenum]WJR34202.1 TetR/AcrR family transcriptional regulator [Mycobacteroides immunogenum]